MRGLALVLLLLFAAMPVQADHVYRWVDAQGQVHYSDSPPPDAKDIETSGVESQDTDQAAIEQRKADQKAAEEAKAKTAAVEAKLHKLEAQETQRKARACLQARTRVEQIQKAMRTRMAYTTDADGNRHYLSEDERQAQLQQAQAAEQQACYQ